VSVGTVERGLSTFVMAGLVPAIHDLVYAKEDVDARHKAGHDGGGWGGASA
jgi:hypothetical protein